MALRSSGLIMQFFNQYSAVILAVLIATAGVIIVWRRGRKIRDWIILDTVLVALVVGWLVFRPVANPAPTATGLPVLLEVQSPYCLGCVALKPAVDRLERQLQGKLAVRRVDIQSAEGRQLAQQHRVEFTPTFILFDAAGREQWRGVGRFDTARIRSFLEAEP